MNFGPSIFLAQLDQLEQQAAVAWHRLAANSGNLILLGALLLVAALALLWARYLRKPHKRHHSQHRPSPRPAELAGQPETADESSGFLRKHKRRRRREHRHRNPTLAETGGLPAIRKERPHDAPSS